MKSEAPKKKLLAKLFASLIILAGITAMIPIGGPSDAYIRSKVVRLSGGGHSCSGQQVRAPSGADYILTAAHCKMIAGKSGSMTVITEDGRELQRRVIAEDVKSDLLLIEGLPNTRGLDIARSLYAGDEVRTFTHGAALATYKTSGSIIQHTVVQIPISQELLGDTQCDSMPKYISMFDPLFGEPTCALSVVETVSTAMSVPGSSGGAVVDNSGELVGVVSGGNDRFSLFVTIVDINQFMHNY